MTISLVVFGLFIFPGIFHLSYLFLFKLISKKMFTKVTDYLGIYSADDMIFIVLPGISLIVVGIHIFLIFKFLYKIVVYLLNKIFFEE